MKKYFLGLIAVMVAVASVAFTTAPEKSTVYYYSFEEQDEAFLGDYTKWSGAFESAPSGCDLTDNVVCTIQTTMDKPTFDAFLQAQNPQIDSRSELITGTGISVVALRSIEE